MFLNVIVSTSVLDVQVLYFIRTNQLEAQNALLYLMLPWPATTTKKLYISPQIL